MLKTCRDCKRFYPEYCDDGRCGHCHNGLIERKAAAAGKAPKPAWCGKCDERTRHREIPAYGDYAAHGADIVMTRCHCHPLYGKPLPQEKALAA